MARTTRLAPSPTGALHLGNARTFLINWAIARREGWRVLMRIEDLDGPRIKRDAAAEALGVLEWLGLDFDGDVAVQSDDLEPYRDAMRRLAKGRRIYRCEMTRREIEAATAAMSAPHAGEHEMRFPPELRPIADDAHAFDAEDANYRILTEPREMIIDDALAGTRRFDPHAEVGDFLVWTRRSAPAYQLAVVVDDARHGVTDVVRGDDLLPSAARQTLLYDALDLEPPRWWHVSLVVGADGRRLAKRHGDTRISSYRDAGVSADRIIELLARWCGVEARTATDFRDAFDPSSLSRDPVTFTEADHAWLLDR